MNAVMYILLASPATTPMTSGKAAAQAAHAAVEAYRLTDPNSNLHKDWYVANHYTKIVLQAPDLAVAERYLNERGITTALIIDEGRTEFGGVLTPTALGCALVNKDNPHIQDSFAPFKLYREQPSRPEPDETRQPGMRVGKTYKPLGCRIGWHAPNDGDGRFLWCASCGVTWEPRYDGVSAFTQRRRDLSYGK